MRAIVGAVPGGDERAADVQPAVDENRGQVRDCCDPVKNSALAEKRVLSPGMGDVQREQLAELRVLLGEPRREGGVQGDVGVLPRAPGQRGRGAYLRIGVGQPFDVGVEQTLSPLLASFLISVIAPEIAQSREIPPPRAMSARDIPSR